MNYLLRFKIPVIARITFGLVGLMASVLMLVSYLQLFPDPQAVTLRSRKQFCETAAIGFSLMAERADANTMQKYLDALSQRGEELQSIAVRREDGQLVVECGDHAAHWNGSHTDTATDSQIWVTFYSQGRPWGTFEAAFEPLAPHGWLAPLNRPEVAHASLVVVACCGVFYFYLRIVLRQLNPSKAIPNRVRDALDTLAEGLLILDRHERIVLANRAFENATGSQADQLLGAPVSRVALICRDDAGNGLVPWQEAWRDNNPVKGRLMSLVNAGAAERTFSVSAAPIMDEKGVARGVLASFEDVTNLEQKKRELAGMVESLRASGEAIKQQNRELERLATRDSLTGCLNRRSFFELFETEWKAAKRHERPLCAMMVDIDFFKSINDNYGHGMGDEVLRQVAATLRNVARESDVVCRYGGEEFSILLPMTTLDDAELVAERIRMAIEQLTFSDFTITASLGVSTQSSETDQPQELLDQADKCLYVAKRGGRNRVVCWDDVPKDLVVDESKIKRTKEPESTEQVSVPYHAVTALISALAYRDQQTATHSRRVADWCVSTAEGLLSLKECYLLEVAALLHDIGKIGVPDHILLKPEALTLEEWDVMRRNDMNGKELIRASFACPALTAIVEHYQAHYAKTDALPNAPTGDQIPVGARILAIADAYDAMTTDRVFRMGCSSAEAFEELRRCAGTQFDPELVERFIDMARGRLALEVPLTQAVSKETALVIGLQIERLSEVLDNRDLDALDALARRLESTALKCGAEGVSAKACELKNVLDAEREPHSILQIANELLDLCRSTQKSFLESHVAISATALELAAVD